MQEGRLLTKSEMMGRRYHEHYLAEVFETMQDWRVEPGARKKEQKKKSYM